MQGQPVCTNYIMYGICKYGPTCRFDHPFMEHSGNYSFGMPMPMLDSSMLSYPRSWIGPQGFETSPSISSKFPDEVQKPESEKYQNSDTKAAEESPEQATGSLPPSPSSSETVQDQSGWSCRIYFLLVHFVYFLYQYLERMNIYYTLFPAPHFHLQIWGVG